MADCKGMAVRDFFMLFNDVNMPVKFCWARTNCKVVLAVSRISSSTSRWRYKYDAIMTERCVQEVALMKHKSLEANRIMHDKVMRTSCFMAKHQSLARRQRRGCLEK